MEIKNVKRASLKEYSSPTGVYVAGQRCWNVDDKAEIALPCATQVRTFMGVNRQGMHFVRQFQPSGLSWPMAPLFLDLVGVGCISVLVPARVHGLL
jgi:hypothetical protein